MSRLEYNDCPYFQLTEEQVEQIRLRDERARELHLEDLEK